MAPGNLARFALLGVTGLERSNTVNSKTIRLGDVSEPAGAESGAQSAENGLGRPESLSVIAEPFWSIAGGMAAASTSACGSGTSIASWPSGIPTSVAGLSFPLIMQPPSHKPLYVFSESGNSATAAGLLPQEY